MKSRMILFVLFSVFPGQVFASALEHHTIFSTVLHRNWDYATYQPAFSSIKSNPLPVVYMLHGFGDTEFMWETDTNLLQMVEVQTMMGLLPAALYVFPSANTTWYLDSKEPMESAIATELVPLIDSTYKTKSSRQGRILCGYSAGGYGAIRFILKYPETFSAAILVSPAVYNPLPPSFSAATNSIAFETAGVYDPAKWLSFNYPTLLDAFVAKQLPIYVYTMSGDKDEFFIDGESATMHEMLRKTPLINSELRIIKGNHNVMSTWGLLGSDALRNSLRAAAEF